MVIIAEMEAELLLMTKHLCARFPPVVRLYLSTFPHLFLEMLRFLVPFPIVLTSKHFFAFGKGTTIWPAMAFLVLSSTNQFNLSYHHR